MKGLLAAADRPDAPTGSPPGWSRSASRMLVVCMALLAAAAGWLVLTRPVHRIEGDFLEREDRQAVDEWLREQLRNPVAELRARAHLALARIRGCEAWESLAAGLRDPAPSVRARSALAAGNLFDARAGSCEPGASVAAALSELLGDDDRAAATRAVEALGKLEWSPAAVAVTRSAAPVVTTMTALMRMNADSQAAFVTEYLDSDDQDSRWAAALAAHELRLAGLPRVWRRLRPLAADDNPFVRAAAMRAVGGSAAGEEALALVGGSLDHADPKVRFEAALARRRLEAGQLSEPLPAGEPAIQLPRLPPPHATLLPSGDYQRVAKTLGARLRMSTALGDFEIELDYEGAPLTAELLRGLAASGAFDGSSFAAVRPNGYAVAALRIPAVRSELNATPFLRGSVGLLRAGAASGGGVFVCQTALPLADGRYVNVGRMVAGDRLLDRVDRGVSIDSLREVR